MNNIIKIVLLFLAFGLFHCSAHAQTKSSLLWATYFGGDSIGENAGLAVDDSGNVYISGYTFSDSGIATAGAYQTMGDIINGDAFLAKFNSSGDLIWATYYGGTGEDVEYNICTDKYGNIYMTGSTTSTSGIATSGAYKTTPAPIFLAKFSTSGSLLWGTYYGSNMEDEGVNVATDSSGDVYMTGYTKSDSGIATSGAHQTLYGGNGDAFLVKFSPSGSLLWGTYYGGSGGDVANGISVNDSGSIYITGATSSYSGIASSGAYQTSYAGSGDVFLAKFNPSGNLLWGTYYGGNKVELGYSLATDYSGSVYVTGSTESASGIATSGAYQTSYAGGTQYGDAFLAKFSTSGNLLWGTYYGGANDDDGSGVATDLSGNVYIMGATNSISGIATSGAYQTSFGGDVDAFLAEFSMSGSLLWATYYGGSGWDDGLDVATDDSGNVYLDGGTESTSGIATSGAFQTSLNSDNGDWFLAKFNLSVKTGNEEVSTSLDNINIFPNPSTNIFNIQINNEYAGNAEVSLSDILGHLITSFSIKSKNEFILNASDYRLKNGVYILTIHSGNNIFTRKLVVE